MVLDYALEPPGGSELWLDANDKTSLTFGDDGILEWRSLSWKKCVVTPCRTSGQTIYHSPLSQHSYMIPQLRKTYWNGKPQLVTQVLDGFDGVFFDYRHSGVLSAPPAVNQCSYSMIGRDSCILLLLVCINTSS